MHITKQHHGFTVKEISTCRLRALHSLTIARHRGQIKAHHQLAIVTQHGLGLNFIGDCQRASLDSPKLQSPSGGSHGLFAVCGGGGHLPSLPHPEQ
jgi:hypothetical protein